MEITGRGTRVRMYFGERDRYHHQPLWSAFLDVLRREGAAGATVLRGLSGYGAHSRIHAASIVDLSADLPLVLEWVDTEERVAALLPSLAATPIPGPPAIKTTALVAALPARLAARADATLAEQCAWWRAQAGITVSTATMSRAIARLGWTRKKSR